MIEWLQVNNVALIESAELTFNKGLNILSGETGAGKSMLIGSVNFLLGNRTGKDFVRHGAEQASVEGMFSINNPVITQTLDSLGIPLESDNMLLISRSVTQGGKTSCKLNGKPVSLAILKEISPMLVDLHGQHEHQSLLNPNRHIELLDKFCGDSLEPLKLQLHEEIKRYKEISKEIYQLKGNTKDPAHMQYQIREIEEASLKEDEEEILLKRSNVLHSFERLMRNALDALELLSGTDSQEPSAIDKISKAELLLADVNRLDPSMGQLTESLNGVSVQLSEIIRDLRGYTGELEHDPGELEKIQSRLDLIYNLKRKYNMSVKEILDYHQKLTEESERLQQSKHIIAELNKERKQCIENISNSCDQISNERKKAVLIIKERIEQVLADLGMNNAQFDIVLERKKEFTPNGYDRVEFLISANPGEPLKPLAKIASGGEMSRIMLALKSVLAKVDNIETFVFDEIDAGVSGRTAHKVAEKLVEISRNYQILCITHLPQIAAMGDSHFLIEKKTADNITSTEVYELSQDKIVREIARLLGGASITDATLNAALELKQSASDLKAC